LYYNADGGERRKPDVESQAIR